MGKDKTTLNEDIEELDGTPEGSSPDESASGASPAGGVKSGTPEGQEQSVPYSRFKEVNEKAKRAEELEEALSEYKDKLVRDPLTGKLKLRFEAPKTEKREPDEDDLTEDEKLAFDEVQARAFQKMTRREIRSAVAEYEKRTSFVEKDRSERTSWWNKTVEKFPDIAKEDSELRKEAEKIVREEYAQEVKDPKTGRVVGVYVPPKANYDATVKAAWNLKERKEEEERSRREAGKMKAQNGFVSKSSKGTPGKESKKSDNFEDLTPDEQQEVLREEFEANQNKDE